MLCPLVCFLLAAFGNMVLIILSIFFGISVFQPLPDHFIDVFLY